MGTWGIAPLENDAALDWLQTLFDQHGLRKQVEEVFQRDVHEYADEMRAAAYVVRILVEAGAWPHDSRERLLTLAADCLEKVIARRVYSNANFVAAVRREIDALRMLKAPSRPCPPTNSLE